MARPLIEDLQSTHHAEAVISSMSNTADLTYDTTRMYLLKQAQAYNLGLGGSGARMDNDGLGGGNDGMADILSLADSNETAASVEYEEQLTGAGSTAMCWLEIDAIAVREPVFHGTSEETLSMGAGHLDSSSLPVGGVSSRCVICAHSGMQRCHMFDDLERLSEGDRFAIHTLGDTYVYEVFQTETLLPEDAASHCDIIEGQDLCTLVTCTPYGINSHRLLVHGRRVPFDCEQPHQTSAAPILNRRTRPLVTLAGGSLVPGFALALLHHIGRAHRARLKRR